MSQKPRRSALYMPASNARAIEKARTLEVDVVILDLEDATAPDAKDAARKQAVAEIAKGGFGEREVVLRVNALDTVWGAEDLAVAAGCGADAVLLPKVSGPKALAEARAALGDSGADLWAMIETVRGIVDLRAIAEAAEKYRLVTLVAGTNDLAKELRCRPGSDRAPLLGALGEIVLAARLTGLVAIDGVCNTLTDADVVRAECEQGLRWGFDGKTLIHPAQVAVANRVFTPSDTEIAWSKQILDAFEQPDNAGKGALQLGGQMVELLHLDEARRILSIAQACGVA
ncbi:HpcH/HpaI aldolase/citrate lyase family protein [Sphingomonas panacis]